jgi:hypothetical protein
MSHNTLINFYQVNFNLMHHYHYLLSEVENMLPWERDIYVSMVMDFVKEQEAKNQQQMRR